MKIQTNYPLAKETTFKCGGKAKFYVEVENLAEFFNILKFHTGKLYILGGGSKTLCVDDGFDGLVISTKKLNSIQFDGDLVMCECGAKLADLNAFCVKNNLTGLEFSMGIPASVGGAVCMNAGSFGGEIGNFVQKVEVFENFAPKILHHSELKFAYRFSSLKNKHISKIWFKLAKAKKCDIIRLQEFYLDKKTSTQPVCVGSAGSIFKRQGDVIPSKIIDNLGLKGRKIGGAEVSAMHSGFIINSGGATATDVINLIDVIKEKVKLECGITLEEEVIILK